MPKYLSQVSFTKEGVKGLAQEGGSKRRQAVEQFFGSVGGKLEAFYFAFGETDVFAIVDFPDNVSAAAISLAGNATAAVDVKILYINLLPPKACTDKGLLEGSFFAP